MFVGCFGFVVFIFFLFGAVCLVFGWLMFGVWLLYVVIFSGTLDTLEASICKVDTSVLVL